MRVLVATTAGAGHVGPTVPFAHALVAAGHEVRVAAPASFAPVVARHGLAHAPFADAPSDELGAVFATLPQLPRVEANCTVVREVFGRIGTRHGLPGVRAIVDAWRPDVIVREPAELASYVVAEAAGIPHVQVSIGLASMDDFIASNVDAPLRELGCATGARALRAVPRLTLVPERFDDEPTQRVPVIHRFRWADLRPDPPPLPPWWPNDELPLVYVTFGSVTAAAGRFDALYPAVVSALADMPLRALLTVGDNGDRVALGVLPSNVHVEKWWPQEDVMPHAAAMVGHGGFGTTMHALAAGVPMVVLPLFSYDQFLNARRVHELGAGVALEDGAPAVAALPNAVQHVLEDPTYAVAAGLIARDIAALPPAAAAVPLIARVAAGT